MMKNVLVVSVHPDDETLGCAGTLLRLKSEGAQIYWLILTQMTKEGGYLTEKMERRVQEIKAVAKSYQMSDVKVLGFATTTLDQVPLNQIVGQVTQVVNLWQPDTIYIPNRSDAHSDHRVAFDALSILVKGFRFPYVKSIFMYETLSETEFAVPLAERVFMPNMFVDISAFIQKKLEIMKLYASELGEHPFPRSEKNILALATLRGATANFGYAEAFMVLKLYV